MYKSKTLIFSFISALLLIAIVNCTAVNAQGDATVIVETATGGVTDVTGTTTYPDGIIVTITATPDDGYVFSTFVISPTDPHGDMVLDTNPVTFTVSSDVTYTVTPVFIIPSSLPMRVLPADLSEAAIVVIYSSAGGTTIPAPGTYAMANAEAFNLTAMPYTGWQFSHWTIYGIDAGHGSSPANWNPTDNPYNVNHGYSATYSYQAVFIPIGTTEPTPTPTPGGTIGGMSTETWIITGLVVVIIIILIVFGIYAAKKK